MMGIGCKGSDGESGREFDARPAKSPEFTPHFPAFRMRKGILRWSSGDGAKPERLEATGIRGSRASFVAKQQYSVCPQFAGDCWLRVYSFIAGKGLSQQLLTINLLFSIRSNAGITGGGRHKHMSWVDHIPSWRSAAISVMIRT